MTSFHCFRDGKCEWMKGLKYFAIQFNNIYGKEYNLSKCLDVSNRTTKQPEVLLQALGAQPMVIECKKIVYPDDYYKNHRHFHLFLKYFQEVYVENLMPKLPQDIYELSINEKFLYQNSEKKLSIISCQIVHYILNHIEEFYAKKEIYFNEPIPWHFHRIPEIDRDQDYISGLRLSGFPKTWLLSNTLAEPEIADKLASHLSSTDKKFQEYADCLKILIIEICGDIVSIPTLDVIVAIIKNANIPSSIDQIWLADPEDESESVIAYHRVV